MKLDGQKSAEQAAKGRSHLQGIMAQIFLPSSTEIFGTLKSVYSKSQLPPSVEERRKLTLIKRDSDLTLQLEKV